MAEFRRPTRGAARLAGDMDMDVEADPQSSDTVHPKPMTRRRQRSLVNDLPASQASHTKSNLNRGKGKGTTSSKKPKSTPRSFSAIIRQSNAHSRAALRAQQRRIGQAHAAFSFGFGNDEGQGQALYGEYNHDNLDPALAALGPIGTTLPGQNSNQETRQSVGPSISIQGQGQTQIQGQGQDYRSSLSPTRQQSHSVAPGSTPTPGPASASKGRGVTRFWMNNSSIAAQKLAAQNAGNGDGYQSPLEDVGAQDGYIGARRSGGTRTERRANKFIARRGEETTRAWARSRFAESTNAGMGASGGVGVGVLGGDLPSANTLAASTSLDPALLGSNGDSSTFPPMPYDAQILAQGDDFVMDEQREFALPFEIQLAAGTLGTGGGNVDVNGNGIGTGAGAGTVEKKGEAYELLRHNIFPERSPLVSPHDNLGDNQSLTVLPVPSVKVKSVGDKGNGLFANQPIQAGQFVIDYRGEIVSTRTYLVRCKTQYSASNTYYAFAYDQDEVIDAGMRGNEARFVNHSCGPNLEIRRVPLGSGNDGASGEYELGLFALREINSGEELSLDYDASEHVSARVVPCLCRSAGCVGKVGRVPGNKSKKELQLVGRIRAAKPRVRAEKVAAKLRRRGAASSTLSTAPPSKAVIALQNAKRAVRQLRVSRYAEAAAMLELRDMPDSVETNPVHTDGTAGSASQPTVGGKKRKGKGRKSHPPQLGPDGQIDADNAATGTDGVPPSKAAEGSGNEGDAASKKPRISGWAEWLKKKAQEQTRTAEEWAEFANKRRRGKAWMQKLMAEYGVAEYPGGPALPFTPTMELPKNGQPNKRGPPPGTPRPPRATKKEKEAAAAAAAAAAAGEGGGGDAGTGAGALTGVEAGSSTGPGTRAGAGAAGMGESGQGGQNGPGPATLADAEPRGNVGESESLQHQQQQQPHDHVHQDHQPSTGIDQHRDESPSLDGDTTIDPALIAALVEHHQRQAEYASRQSGEGEGGVEGDGNGNGDGGTGQSDHIHHHDHHHDHTHDHSHDNAGDARDGQGGGVDAEDDFPFEPMPISEGQDQLLGQHQHDGQGHGHGHGHGHGQDLDNNTYYGNGSTDFGVDIGTGGEVGDGIDFGSDHQHHHHHSEQVGHDHDHHLDHDHGHHTHDQHNHPHHTQHDQHDQHDQHGQILQHDPDDDAALAAAMEAQQEQERLRQQAEDIVLSIQPRL